MPRYVNTEKNSNIEAIVTYPQSKIPNIFIIYKNHEEHIEGDQAILEKIHTLCDWKNQCKNRKISKEIEESIKSDFPLIFSSNLDLSNVKLATPVDRRREIISYGIRNTFNERTRQNEIWMGIKPEDTPLPPILRGSKVVDVGAGDGFMTQRLRDELNCDAHALEPCIEYKTGYNECVRRLGKDHAFKLTLQEAINTFPDIFKSKFDVATVFKYNIPGEYKEEFIKALAQIITPNGTVYITSVERDRLFFESKSGEVPYIRDILEKYFDHVKIDLIHVTTYGVYGLVECASPRLELQNTQKFGMSQVEAQN